MAVASVLMDQATFGDPKYPAPARRGFRGAMDEQLLVYNHRRQKLSPILISIPNKNKKARQPLKNRALYGTRQGYNKGDDRLMAEARRTINNQVVKE